MDEKLQKELAIQTQNFRGLIAEYCRFESVAAQNRMMNETAGWVEALPRETGFAQGLRVRLYPNHACFAI